MIFREAEKEDFYKIRSLHWNLIDQEQAEALFPHWKKGIHPSDEMIQNSIDREELYVLSDDEEIAACVISCRDEIMIWDSPLKILCSFYRVKDNYEKIVLILDRFTIGNYEEIKGINVLDWLLGKER